MSAGGRRDRRLPRPHHEEQAEADGERDRHADHAGDARAEPVVVDALHRVARRRRAIEGLGLLRVGEALVDGDLVQAVGLAACPGADEEGQGQGDREAGHDEPDERDGPRAPHRTATAVRSSSSCSSVLAPWTRSGRTASTAPMVIIVMIPSPMPMSTWTPTMAPATVATDALPVPPMAYSTVKATEA